MAMDASVNYLLNIVRSEIKHAENIYSFLQEKENSLINNDIRSLKNLIFREHSLFVKSKELEVSRFAVLEVVAKKLNLPANKLTLTVLADNLGDAYRNTIIEIRNILSSIISKVKRQNQKCDLLVKKSMELITHSMNLISGKFMQKTKMVYNINKKPDDKYYSNSILDRRG